MLRTVVGALQQYDWGDTTALPRLLNVEPNGQPWAEMWFGTHHVAPSSLDDGKPLSDVTGEMSMLVKLLSCARPLSLQTHPNAQQARDGYDRDEVRGVDRNSPARVYRDASDKPEMLIALTTFEALCGFAPIDSSIALLHAIGWSNEARVLDEHGIDGYLLWAFEQTTPPLLDHAPEWLLNIAQMYPHDAALRVAPLLNHIVLQPAEAIALPAGNLHAYLNGTGLEVMKSSDNVVRAGFTSKHIDVPELLRIVDSTELLNPIARTTTDGPVTRYASPSGAFTVEAIESATDSHLAAIEQHRLIVGPFDSALGVKLLVAGDSATLPGGNGVFWVCTQN